MTGKDRAAANREAFGHLCAADPVLTDIRMAADVLPGMTATTILTSGPVMAWRDYEGGQRNAVICAVAVVT